jgi:hypothetical protein
MKLRPGQYKAIVYRPFLAYILLYSFVNFPLLLEGISLSKIKMFNVKHNNKPRGSGRTTHDRLRAGTAVK